MKHNRTFTLTPAGKLFYHKSKDILFELVRLLKEVKQTNQNNSAKLRIGYLKNYNGMEFQNTASIFSSKYPNVQLEVINGNHEDLYYALRNETVDLILNDQRRAFSDNYVNLELFKSHVLIEISSRYPIFD